MRVEVSQLPPVECSPNFRGNWRKRHKAGKVYQEAVFYECIQARNMTTRLGGEWHPFKRPRLDLTFVFPYRRKRDEDNLRARFKSGQDALVLAGLIGGDTKDNLILGDINIEVDPELAPLTIIELRGDTEHKVTYPPRADETDKCPPHWWKITTDKDGNEIHQCCKPGCSARKAVTKDKLDKLERAASRFPPKNLGRRPRDGTGEG